MSEIAYSFGSNVVSIGDPVATRLAIKSGGGSDHESAATEGLKSNVIPRSSVSISRI